MATVNDSTRPISPSTFPSWYDPAKKIQELTATYISMCIGANLPPEERTRKALEEKLRKSVEDWSGGGKFHCAVLFVVIAGVTYVVVEIYSRRNGAKL